MMKELILCNCATVQSQQNIYLQIALWVNIQNPSSSNSFFSLRFLALLAHIQEALDRIYTKDMQNYFKLVICGHFHSIVQMVWLIDQHELELDITCQRTETTLLCYSCSQKTVIIQNSIVNFG